MQCPLCSDRLELRAVAPCFDCGHAPDELGELEREEHDYHRYELFGQTLVLCDFCDVDFASYYPEYLGLPEGSCRDYPLERLSKVDSPKPAEDWYCPSCQRRLAFVSFLVNAREHNSA